jgi:two-component system chemotaxis sensor kinase CheA
MAQDPYRYFRIEAHELLTQLGQAALALEQAEAGGAAELVARLLRLAHTLKGAARVVKLPGIADQAHAIEDLLAPLREAGAAAAPARAQIDALLALQDDIAAQLRALTPPPLPLASATTGAVTAPAPAEPDLPPQTLDALLAGIEQAQARLQPLQQALALARTQAARPDPARLAALERLLDQGLYRLERELGGLRESAEQLRLTPAGQLFVPLQRIARDAAQALGKQLVFEASGADVRLEVALLGPLQAALAHAVRNAVVHGIEAPATRLAAGKPAAGQILLTVERRERRVLIRCRDDGAGIDLAALRRAATAKGWPEAQADEATLLRRLLRGGLSTAARVDALAGRGIGMDMLHDTVERLGGRLELHSAAGQGCTLELWLPLQLAALQALAVQAGGRRHYLPLAAVQQVLRHPEQEAAALELEGELLPVLALATALAERQDEPGPLLVLSAGGQRAALRVARLEGVVSVLLRPPPALLPDSPLVAGLVLEAGAAPRLVLDPAGLIACAAACARQGPPRPRPQPAAPPTVLVVDDSLTTRMMEQSILEAAGYTVHLAESAEQALEVARRQRYALFLVDVEMPGMDGFGFIEHTRADPQLRAVPAILVSSRNSPQDIQRGREVGASAYIVKSEFAQHEFLRQVRELVQVAA